VDVEVSFFAQGAFNKLYDIQVADLSLILRISLPVDPLYKTMSEIATIGWVQENINIPVPRLFDFNLDRADPIGFEWMLLSKLPGKPLAEEWRCMPFAAKERLVKQFAAFSSSLFEHQLEGIGNLYSDLSVSKCQDDDPGKFITQLRNPAFRVGRIVSMQFFWGDHINMDVLRGPFLRSREWIAARMALNERDCVSTLARYERAGDDEADGDAEDVVDDAKLTLQIIGRLRGLLDHIFSDENHNEVEPSMLFHDDLSAHNVLVDGDGALTGVVDWECVSVLPLWKACYFPAFLQGSPRPSKPDPNRYKRELGNREPSDLYRDHLNEYELTKLRSLFLDEMAELQPAWMGVFNSNQLKRDFETAVHNCDNEMLMKTIIGWIDDVETAEKDVRSLRDRIDD